jgi:hypothetical protein
MRSYFETVPTIEISLQSSAKLLAAEDAIPVPDDGPCETVYFSHPCESGPTSCGSLGQIPSSAARLTSASKSFCKSDNPRPISIAPWLSPLRPARLLLAALPAQIFFDGDPGHVGGPQSPRFPERRQLLHVLRVQVNIGSTHHMCILSIPMEREVTFPAACDQCCRAPSGYGQDCIQVLSRRHSSTAV